MLIKNHPEIRIVNMQDDLGVFYGVTNVGTPVWGRLDALGNATEIHPLYVRNNHSNIIAFIAEAMTNDNDKGV